MTLEIYAIAIVAALACAVPGIFLVLRGTSMLSDAITHSVLLGIVLAFFITHDLNSPLLLVGATLVGVLVVWCIEALQRTKLMGEDAAIGSVFPLFFSLGLILITQGASDVHLDTDSVMMGELAFAPFKRLIAFGYDWGPKSLWTMLFVLLINVIFVAVFWKELKLSTFDPAFAAALGFSPVLIHYGLMTLVSLTAVGAYDTVGSILVVGFMVGPALSAYLLTDDLKKLLLIAMVYAVVNSIIGTYLGFLFDVSLAGAIGSVTGFTSILTFLLSPRKGLIVNRRRYQAQKQAFDSWLASQSGQNK
ncbi:zinc ABC transporter permease [Aerococcus urinaehominis]|uniref:Zinc ABC transporter permease n=1 Tax=Aerococcus urinaehominis TaxID=128944 RepID=A0A0X8FJV0_9LACT|nr:metal ABC transporter permease [Aerococcus urinaehominis]AMB98641.1 zinc ABC transporter permease [Aerococcus urinaehominis]SDL96549.1 manganese/zinc/iron transport system permease protein [Aerococcus urinaehominis]